MTSPYALRDAFGDGPAMIHLAGVVVTATLVGTSPSWMSSTPDVAVFVAFVVVMFGWMFAADRRLRTAGGTQ